MGFTLSEANMEQVLNVNCLEMAIVVQSKRNVVYLHHRARPDPLQSSSLNYRIICLAFEALFLLLYRYSSNGSACLMSFLVDVMSASPPVISLQFN